MASIREYISSKLLAPLKKYPTLIQDTMVEIITEKFERLYEYTLAFPEIVSPNINRLDILQVIADQFLFTIREEADLQEQIDILDKILYVYNKRGSVDTIENMWKYYGGNLPKDIEVIVPSYNLFRYNVSALSGNHSYLKGRDCYIELKDPVPEAIVEGSTVKIASKSRTIVITSTVTAGSTTVNIANSAGLEVGDEVDVDGKHHSVIVGVSNSNKEVLYDSVNTPGVYEIKLYNSTYPIPELKEFLLRELVAAGNEIYFTNALYMQNISGDINSNNPYRYSVTSDHSVQIQLEAMAPAIGLQLSGSDHSLLSLYDKLSPPSILPSESSSYWSGSAPLFVELAHAIDMSVLDSPYMQITKYMEVTPIYTLTARYFSDGNIPSVYRGYSSSVELDSIFEYSQDISIDSKDPDTMQDLPNYQNYFILGATLLGTNYEISEVMAS